MGQLLKSNYHRFRISFAPDFFSKFEHLKRKYDKILRQQPDLFTDVVKLLEHTVQSFPSLELGGSAISQGPSAASYERTFLNAGLVDSLKDGKREFTLEFSTYYGYTCYYFMKDVLYSIYEYPRDELLTYLPYIQVDFLSNYGTITQTEIFHNILFTELTPNMDYSYSNTEPEFRSFTCNFNYQYSKIIEHY